MRDKTVINIISKTYFTIVSLLSVIFLSLITIFIILQHGLFIENLSLPNITIKKTYIKWNKQLNISIDEIEIKKSSKPNEKVALKDIQKYLRLTSRFFLFDESLVIDKLSYNDITLHIKYNSEEKGLLIADAPSFNSVINFQFQKDFLIFNIQKLKTEQTKLDLNGQIILDINSKKIFSKLNILFNNNKLNLYAVANTKELQYKIKSLQKIKNVHQTLTLLDLPNYLNPWVTDAITSPALTIHSCKGFIQYNDLKSAYKDLSIYATLDKLDYIYNNKVDAIHTKKTDLKFENGILYIYPREAYSYNMYLDKSWLKIDFTKPQELLTLQLLFNGMLNNNMLHILSSYNIQLPFLQHTGIIKTDLKLTVNLRTIDVNAVGTFVTKKANFDYDKLNLDIKNTTIKLNNYNVIIDKMNAQYKKLANADVSGSYNAKTSKGVLNFKVNTIDLAKDQYLNMKKKPLHVKYQILPKGDTIVVDKSQWLFNGYHATLNAVTLPLDLKSSILTIPTCYFSLEDIADGFVTGKVNIKDLTASAVVDLLHLKYQAIKLAQSNSELHLKYDKTLFISSKNDIFLSVNGSQYKIKNFSLAIDNKNIFLKNTTLNISQYIKTKINVTYNRKMQNAKIKLNHFILINPKNKKLLYYNNKIALSFKAKQERIKITSKELKAKFTINNDRWMLHLNSLRTIAKNSNFLQKYKLTNGKISFYKNSNDKYTKFRGFINYKYKLLTDQNRSIKRYNIEGYVTQKQSLYCDVNKKVNIKVADNIKINMHKSGINVDELLKFVNLLTKQNQDKKVKKAPITLFFKAKNSYLYFGNKRYVISDNMSLQYYKNMLTAQLSYKKGEAGFKLENKKFHLYGKNFNDQFMEKLFSLSKFKGGSLDFSMSGTFQDYKGTFYINKTTMQDYILLNNILAFINTVPSLATFSLPGYSTEGLYIKNAYMKFHLKNHIFNISDIYIGSKELKIVGKGTASVKYNNIDLALNLKTDLASNLSKIPLVGYIIFDGQSISTTLKITGKLTDPKVETMLARDIVVAPLNIILRTITLPYKLIKDMTGETKKSPKK